MAKPPYRASADPSDPNYSPWARSVDVGEVDIPRQIDAGEVDIPRAPLEVSIDIPPAPYSEEPPYKRVAREARERVAADRERAFAEGRPDPATGERRLRGFPSFDLPPEIAPPADYGDIDPVSGQRLDNVSRGRWQTASSVTLPDVNLTDANVTLPDQAMVPSGGGMAPRPPDPFEGIPDELKPGAGGTYYPPKYDLMVLNAMNEKIITPDQAKSLIAKHKAWKDSDVGLEAGAMRLEREVSDERMGAAAHVQDVDAEGWANIQQAMDRGLLRADEVDRERIRFQNNYQEIMGREMASYKEAVQRMENQTIDPYRGFVGGSVLAGISQALIGVGGILSKRDPGSLLNIVNSAVERNIKTQEIELSNKRAGISARYNLMSQMQQHFGNMDQAREATRKAVYDKLQLYVNSLSAGSRSDVTKAKAEMMRAGLDKLGLAAEMRLRGQLETRARAAAYRSSIAALQNRSQVNTQTGVAGANRVEAYGTDAKDWRNRYSKDMQGFYNSAESREQHEMISRGYDEMEQAFRELREIHSQVGGGVGAGLDADIQKRYGSVVERIAFAQRRLGGTKEAFDKGFLELIRLGVPNVPTSYAPGEQAKYWLSNVDDQAARALDFIQRQRKVAESKARADIMPGFIEGRPLVEPPGKSGKPGETGIGIVTFDPSDRYVNEQARQAQQRNQGLPYGAEVGFQEDPE